MSPGPPACREHLHDVLPQTPRPRRPSLTSAQPAYPCRARTSHTKNEEIMTSRRSSLDRRSPPSRCCARGGAAALLSLAATTARQANAHASRAPPATPVSVATVEQSDIDSLGRVLRPARSGRARRRALARRRRRAVGAFPRRRAGAAGRPADHDRPGALRGRGRARRSAGRGRAGARQPAPRASSSARSACWEERAISQRELDERAQRPARGRSQPARGRGRAAVGAARISATPQVRAPVAGPRRQARDHGRQPGRRRAPARRC